MSTVARRRFGVVQKLEIMARQARCPLCGERLGALDNLDWDHIVPLGLGGADAPENMQAAHRQCHRVKTSGNPATSAGSDIHAIAKTKRLSADQEAFRRQVLAKEPGRQRAKSSPIPSRPFPSRPRKEARK